VGVLADLEIHHSRPIAPTRRVALGRANLPIDPPPGFGGLLLGGMVARYIGGVDPDLHPDLLRLTIQLEEGRRIPQPRLRYRFQSDRVGLLRSRFQLLGRGDEVVYDFEHRGTPAQAVLGAVYAVGAMDPSVRNAVMSTVRRGMSWGGALGPDLIAHLSGVGIGYSVSAFGDPVAWALNVLGFAVDGSNGPKGRGNGARNGHATDPQVEVPPKNEVQRRFRDRLREVHPDHGGATDDAARRIADLAEARRILIG
jgi:hypothetical protein